MNGTKAENLTQFACPKCKKIIQSIENGLLCEECDHIYPIIKNIPDFTSENLKANPIYRSIKKMEFLAPIYEGKLWHSFILKGFGAKKSSLGSIVDFVIKSFNGITGNILDVACGPATYGRRIASNDRQVYGIDFSMGTLKQGMKNIARDSITNIKLARANVEELPFENNIFDGVICNGALHLFPNTQIAYKLRINIYLSNC
ncbi:methyltransferase domain-containing protein [Bacteroidota bacterium]